VLTRDLLRIAGARRRIVLVGEGAQLAELRRILGRIAAVIRYEYVGAIAPSGDAGDQRALGARRPVPGAA
jgi:hypothetical protein